MSDTISLKGCANLRRARHSMRILGQQASAASIMPSTTAAASFIRYGRFGLVPIDGRVFTREQVGCAVYRRFTMTMALRAVQVDPIRPAAAGVGRR